VWFLLFSLTRLSLLLQNKDTTDSRSRGANNASNRSGKGGADRYAGRGGSNQFSSTGMWKSQSSFLYLFVGN
jgi:hypothetical protein